VATEKGRVLANELGGLDTVDGEKGPEVEHSEV